MVTKNFDWLALERKYVEGDMSLRALAREHKISLNAVFRQSKLRRWAEKRATYRKRRVAGIEKDAGLDFDDRRRVLIEDVVFLRKRVMNDLMARAADRPEA